MSTVENRKAEIKDQKPDAADFEFREDGAHAGIYYNGEKILRLETHDRLTIKDQCMEPGAGPELAWLQPFAFFGYKHSISEVRYDVEQETGRLSLAITPTNTLSGPEAFGWVQEKRTLTVWLEDGKFAWDERLEINVLKDVDIATLSKKTPLRVYLFPHQDGRKGTFFQFSDPVPCYSSGPAVPMTRDWGSDRNPYTGPEGFTKDWKRRWVKIILQNPDGSYSWSDLNKNKWYWLTMDNMSARPCHPKGPFYLGTPDGSALEYKIDAPSHYHHVCEWAMDFHCWADLEPFLDGTVLPAGTRIEASNEVRLVGPEVAEPILEQAEEILLTETEFIKANLPAYEEPENTFTVSCLEPDRLDSWSWHPSSEGCRWEKTGGYKEGTGWLIIENKISGFGSWEEFFTGPSHWGNPFVKGARYRLSAWVKVDPCDCDALESGPQVGVLFSNSTAWPNENPSETQNSGWSDPLTGPGAARQKRIPWTCIEVVTEPCPSHGGMAALRLRFTGRGTAYFSCVRWELVDG